MSADHQARLKRTDCLSEGTVYRAEALGRRQR